MGRMKKRGAQAAGLVLALILLYGVGGFQDSREAHSETECAVSGSEEGTGVVSCTGEGDAGTESQADDREKDARKETAIVYDNRYEKDILSPEQAREEIRQEAELQRASCGVREAADIERAMEKDFGIYQVTLGEMEPELAQKVYDACSYMFSKYPVLYGKLTNFSLGNLPSGAVAVSEYTDFISPEKGIYPIVMKRQVILNARDFLNEERLTNLIRKSAAEGHWMADMNIEALVVHELGHILLGEIRMERYGLDEFCYISVENEEAFSAYNTDVLSANQTTAREIVEGAYADYGKEHGISLEEARGMISGYAKGEQADGGSSYEETIAEAVADVYLHGEQADTFSLHIVTEMEQNWLFIPFPVSSVAKSTQKNGL